MLETRRISYQCEQLGQVPASISTLVTPYATVTRHRAATTGATPFIQLLLASESTGSFKKPRLNLQDRAGNTPLHLGRSDLLFIGTGTDQNRSDSYREWSRRSRSRLVSSPMYFLPAFPPFDNHSFFRIEAGADRQRTNTDGYEAKIKVSVSIVLICCFRSERPEDIGGVGGQEGRRLLDYIKERCGKLE